MNVMKDPVVDKEFAACGLHDGYFDNEKKKMEGETKAREFLSGPQREFGRVGPRSITATIARRSR